VALKFAGSTTKTTPRKVERRRKNEAVERERERVQAGGIWGFELERISYDEMRGEAETAAAAALSGMTTVAGAGRLGGEEREGGRRELSRQLSAQPGGFISIGTICCAK